MVDKLGCSVSEVEIDVGPDAEMCPFWKLISFGNLHIRTIVGRKQTFTL